MVYNFNLIKSVVVVFLFQICNVSGTSCGRVNITRPLIYNGSASLRGEWPFIAALLNKSQFFCGGTVITNRHVLTAAHCIQQKHHSVALSHTDLAVRLGAHNITAEYEAGMIERNVTEIHIHPEWDVYVDKYDADIAVLDLNEKVSFTNYIQPICLPVDVAAIDGVEGSIVGWGMGNNGRLEQIPQSTVTKVLTAAYCYTKDPGIAVYSSPNTFCGGDGKGTPNSGDSGGGMYVVNNRSWVQYGIISAVRTNETGHVMENSFAVYTNIITFKNWIIDQAQMNDDMNITLRCHYGPEFFYSKYKCFLYNLDIRGNNTEIASFAADSHHPGKTDEDVNVIQFYNGSMLFLPNGIGKFFNNLKVLIVGHSNSSFMGTKLVRRLNFKDLTRLEDIRFYRNEIEVLEEDSLWDLEHLGNFRLNYNKLKVLHERTFEKNARLTTLSLHSNEMKFLPKELLKNNLLLESVDVSRNSLETIDENLFETNERLKMVYLGSNHLKILPTNLFSNNLLLEVVFVNGNSLKEIDENVFQNNVKLMTVNLESNQLEYLPRNLFKNNLLLNVANFRQNALKIIESDFIGNENIRSIDFYGNVCIDELFNTLNVGYHKTKNLTEFQIWIQSNCRRLS